MKKIVKRIGAKIKTKVANLACEEQLPDLSIWSKDENGNPVTPVYIETKYMSEQANEFRVDYRKVIMCITSVKDGTHVPACRKLYTTFVAKWQLDSFDPNARSKNRHLDTQLKMTICGYVENLLQLLETKYALIPTPADDDVVVTEMDSKNQKSKDSSM